ncbi:MAG: putative glyoxalase superfamily protein PhnB [Phenylobacterium sp.]|jgi:uncharacterized glyoxalase superfamily protein PhnB
MTTTEKVPNPPVGMPRIAPHLFYNDVGAAIDFLVKAFDFKIRTRMKNDQGTVVHGDLEVEDSLVMLGLTEEHDHWQCPNSFAGQVSQRLFIYVDNIDAHFERAKAAGAQIHSQPADQWHGERVYEAVDPEGHRWKFAQAIFEIDQNDIQRPPELNGVDVKETAPKETAPKEKAS